jgi:hypothetical protein
LRSKQKAYQAGKDQAWQVSHSSSAYRRTY